MQIDGNMKIGSLKGTTPTRQSTPAATKAAGDATAFAGTTALEGALGQVPDVRSESVTRARELINDPAYPSADVVKKLSYFLADKITSPQD